MAASLAARWESLAAALHRPPVPVPGLALGFSAQPPPRLLALPHPLMCWVQLVLLPPLCFLLCLAPLEVLLWDLASVVLPAVAVPAAVAPAAVPSAVVPAAAQSQCSPLASCFALVQLAFVVQTSQQQRPFDSKPQYAAPFAYWSVACLLFLPPPRLVSQALACLLFLPPPRPLAAMSLASASLEQSHRSLFVSVLVQPRLRLVA